MAENIGVDQREQFLVLFDGLRANALPRMTDAIVETAIGARGGESRYKSDEHREREKRRRTCVAPYQALLGREPSDTDRGLLTDFSKADLKRYNSSL